MHTLISRRWINTWLVLALFTFSAFAESTIKVLVVVGGHGFEKEPFYRMFEENADITFTAAMHVKTNASVYERDDLLNYDVVVLYDMQKEISDAQKGKLFSLFDKGIGLVVLHHALAAYQQWPEYEK